MSQRGWSVQTAALGFLALGLLVCSNEPGAPHGSEQSLTGAADPAPDFTLEDLEGQRVSLKSFRGRVVLIDFWATWCAPCVFQIPVLNAFYADHRDDGVVVLGVAVDAEGRKVVAPFAAEQRIQYPVLLGNESLAWRYGAPGFPALAIVDARGRIDSLHVGVVDRGDLEAAVRRLAPRVRTASGDSPT